MFQRSSILLAVAHEDDAPAMPPKKKLSAEQLDDLSRWIADGAAWPADQAAAAPGSAPVAAAFSAVLIAS